MNSKVSLNKSPKKKTSKTSDKKKENSTKSVVTESPKNLSAKDLAKINKKKAKKQAQKLKKQQNKVKNNVAVEAAVPEKPDAIKKEYKRDPATDDATVFVGNLPINTKRVQLVRLFQPYGIVQSIRLRTAGGKQLFKHKQRKEAGSLNAYVVLQNPQIAQSALALNGVEFKDNHLRVTPAKKVKGGDGSGEVNDVDSKNTVFVGNLKYSTNEEMLREIFSSCGVIDYIRCLRDGDKGCKGVAYVCFKNSDSVGLALELNQTLLDDRPINVERYSNKKLGAKQKRDAASATSVKSEEKRRNSAGAKKRLDKKQNGKNTKQAIEGQQKKSNYRGVKVGAVTKAKHSKKKGNDHLNNLAKKIAPKIRT
ncbi:uncharacterized protein [Drosophila bipectinata]|uniref:uncharacterized protein n=1 Tax=Drosophila bipectinata TaxID=42026 RepID=UPI0038B2A669